mmetsp:Transcript_13376/g.53662  ORF Transcript_13376/g.53662 Transcript_13376/m.53662 type:complete len:261 (+) Transcript_13376:861-1643(+)
MLLCRVTGGVARHHHHQAGSEHWGLRLCAVHLDRFVGAHVLEGDGVFLGRAALVGHLDLAEPALLALPALPAEFGAAVGGGRGVDGNHADVRDETAVLGGLVLRHFQPAVPVLVRRVPAAAGGLVVDLVFVERDLLAGEVRDDGFERGVVAAKELVEDGVVVGVGLGARRDGLACAVLFPRVERAVGRRAVVLDLGHFPDGLRQGLRGVGAEPLVAAQHDVAFVLPLREEFRLARRPQARLRRDRRRPRKGGLRLLLLGG